MTNDELIEFGAKPIKRKFKIFLIIGASLFGVSILSYLIIALGLATSEELKNNTVGAVGTFVIISIIFTIPSIVLLLIALQEKRKLNDKDKLLAQGTKAYNDRKQREEIDASKKAAIEASKKADFEIDKEFIAAKAMVWININKKLIQFSLPSGNYLINKDKGMLIGWLFDRKEELLQKTKVLNLDDLVDIELIHDYEKVTDTYLNGVRLRGDMIGSVDGKLSSQTTTYHYYQVEFKFKDIDYPIIHIYFNNDRAKAETLYETVKLISGK